MKGFGTFNTPNHAASDSYVRVVLGDPVGGVPVLLPAAGEDMAAQLLPRLDGLILTGSRSNVCPQHYDGPPHAEGTPEDHARDATTLPLIRAAIAAGLPTLAICRGMQELNVALGGSLHQLVHELPGKLDHRGNRELPRQHRYDPRHVVRLTPGSQCQRLAGGAAELLVNSLHAQAIDRLADGLVVEAVADDGTIEAVRVKDAQSFALGIQWHPEARLGDCSWSQALFSVFGDACRAYAARKRAFAASSAA